MPRWWSALVVLLACAAAHAVELPTNDGEDPVVLALDGGEWFVYWNDSFTWHTVARVDDAGNVVYGPVTLDRAGMSVDDPRFAWNGARVGLAYRTMGYPNLEVWFHLLDENGTAVSTPVLVGGSGAAGYSSLSDLAWAEGEFLVGYWRTGAAGQSLWMRRVDASGAIASPELEVLPPSSTSVWGPWVARMGGTLAAAWQVGGASPSLSVALLDLSGNLLVPPTPYVVPIAGGSLFPMGLSSMGDRYGLVFSEYQPLAPMSLETLQIDVSGAVLLPRSTLHVGPVGYYFREVVFTSAGLGLAGWHPGASPCPCPMIHRTGREGAPETFTLDMGGITPGYDVRAIDMDARADRYGVVWQDDRASSGDSNVFFTTAPTYALWAAGAGPSPAAAPQVRVLQPEPGMPPVATFAAYAGAGYGCRLGSGDIDGTGTQAILTAPGPGIVLGPQVRAFSYLGTAIPKVSFYAYSTLKYGASARGGDVDGDGFEEILTTPGPGVVFGPHVRGFDYDGTSLSAMAKLSFFAYGTLRYGANADGGDVDADGAAEILTGPGPGSVFGSQLRGFAYGAGGVVTIPGINAVIFPAATHGLVVASGSTDADAAYEIAGARGPAPAATAEVAVFDVVGGGLLEMPGSRFAVFGGPTSGAQIAFSQWMDADVPLELFVSRGPSPASPSEVRVADDGVAGFGTIAAYDPFPSSSHGSTLAGAAMGF